MSTELALVDVPVTRRSRSRGRRVLAFASTAVQVAVTAVLVAAVLWVWPARLGGHTTLVAVSGNSMLPTIEPGQMALARKASSYEIGDVVVYPIPGPASAGGGRLVIHRVVAVTGSGTVVTRGDNRATDDPWIIDLDDVRGKVIWVGGDVIWLQRTAALIANPVSFALITGLLTWWMVRVVVGPQATQPDGQPASREGQ